MDHGVITSYNNKIIFYMIHFKNNFEIFALVGAKITPFSVIIPVTNSAGVTSKAGLRTSTPFAAH